MTRKKLVVGILFSMGLCTPLCAQTSAFSSLSSLSSLSSMTSEAKALYQYQMKDRNEPQVVENANLSLKNLYQSPVDGCYYGIGKKSNTYDPMGIDCDSCLETGGKLKINGSYVWGLTSLNHKIYWGTGNNLLCWAPSIASVTVPAYETSCWACEAEKGIHGETLGNAGDLVPPRVFVYDKENGTVKDITPDDSLELGATCYGLRSAGAFKNVIFLGGPDIKYGSTVYAFSSNGDKFLGVSHFDNISTNEEFQVTNIRKWKIIDGVLYCGVKYKEGTKEGGAILRWTGSEDDPFKFDIVGYTEGEAAELEYHDGRIYVAGWPAGSVSAGIYRSKLLPAGGFTTDDAELWETVWRFSQYETDPFVLYATGFGGFKSFKGRLYWGMLHITWGYPFVVSRVYGATKADEMLSAILGVFRASSLFSASDFSTSDDVEMLYGEEKLPKYNFKMKEWKILPNASGYKAKWGRSGFGNLFTNYIWSMNVYNDKLYIGTMDMSNLFEPALASSLVDISASSITNVVNLMKIDKNKYGYECMVIDDPEKEPTLITNNGFGNEAAYGLRNMIVDDNVLYAGTANPMSLHEKGGWQLLSLTDHTIPTSNTIVPQEAKIQYRQAENYVEIASLNNEIINNIVLVDMSGRIVRTVQPQSTQGILVTGDLASGAYIARVATPSETKSIKLVIK